MWGPAGALVDLGSNSSLGPGKISLGGGTSSDLFTALEYAGMARSLPEACSGSPGIPALDMPLLCSQLSPTGQGRAYPWKSHGLDQVRPGSGGREGASVGGSCCVPGIAHPFLMYLFPCVFNILSIQH